MLTKSKFRKFRSTEPAVFLTQQISCHILFVLQQKWAHRQDPQALQKNKLQSPLRDLNLYSASDNGKGEPSSQMACPAGRSLLVVARAEAEAKAVALHLQRSADGQVATAYRTRSASHETGQGCLWPQPVGHMSYLAYHSRTCARCPPCPHPCGIRS